MPFPWSRKINNTALDEEMQFHIDARAAELVRRGLDEREALRQARLEFGSVAARREDCRESKGLVFLDQLRSDLQFATRILRKQPGLSLTAILFLAIAVGANTAFFAFVNAYRFRPLPIRGADRHADIMAYNERQEPFFLVSRAQYDALARQAKPIAEIYSIERLTLPLTDHRVRRAAVEVVSPNFFPLLLGVNNPDGAILSHAGWIRLFQRDPNIAGKRIRLGSQFFMVTGVAPSSFTGVEAVIPDMWLPQSQRPLAVAPGTAEQMQVGAIVHAGVAMQQAQAALGTATAALSEGLAAADSISTVSLMPRKVISRDDEGNAVVVGLTAFPFVLLLVVACANLASLYLAGASARQRELAIRLAVGASRARVVRQLMTEAILLALLGAVAACTLAFASLQALETFLFQIMTRVGMNFVPSAPDWRTMAVAIALAMVSAVLFGLLPALEATDQARDGRPSLISRGNRPTRMRRGLLVTQSAASLVLLVLAGILLDNAARFDAMNPGFPLRALYESGFEGDPGPYAKRLESHPRVASVTGVGRVPLRGIMERRTAIVENQHTQVFFNFTDHRYLETMQIPLVAGRNFTAAEAHGKLPVAIVSEATARRLWPGRSAIGQSFQLDGSKHLYQVTGVVKDVVSSFFFIGTDPTLVYLPAAAGSPEIHNLIVRTRDSRSTILPELQNLCLSAAPQSYCEPGSFEDIAWIQRLPFRMASQVAMALGIVSVLLSCVGLYGVVAFLVERRRKEAGIRLALGSPRSSVMLAMSAASLKSLCLGIGIGLPVCFMAAKFAESAAVYLRLSEPLVFLGAPLLLLLIGVAAALLPARRAANVDPAWTLRQD